LPEAYSAILRSEIHSAQLKFTSAVEERLICYCQELDRWNRRINLTSLSGADLVKRLVIEPVWIGENLKMSGTLVDIGSGNGSPAIPLCLTQRFSAAHLVEARSRRAAFLRHVIGMLQIGAEVHRARFDDAIDGIPPADWITLQAVQPGDELIRAMRRVSGPTTTAVWITSSGIPLSFGTPLKTPFRDTQAVLFKPAAL
jgi:16S rRNA (guanine(527)-N(7))-methyltransferase RsmG